LINVGTVITAHSIADLAALVGDRLPDFIVEPHAEISGDEFVARVTRIVAARRRTEPPRIALVFRSKARAGEWTLDTVSILPRNVHRIGGPLV
jgi:hypothetical protein